MATVAIPIGMRERVVFGATAAAVGLYIAIAAADLSAQNRIGIGFSEVVSVGRPGDLLEFSLIRGVAYLPDGDLTVLDDHSVVIVDGEGRELRRWGRLGGGPEEFTRPSAIGVSPRGDILVGDMPRVMAFDPSGELLTTHGRTAQGSVVAAIGSDRSGVPVVMNTNFMGSVHVSKMVEDGSALWGREGAGVMANLHLFGPRPSMVDLGDGLLAIIPGDTYELPVFDLETGEEVGVVRRDVAIRPVPSDFREKVLEYMADPSAAPETGWTSIIGSGSRAVPENLIARIVVAETFPVVTGGFVGPHNTLWLRRGVGVGDDLAAPIDPPDGHGVSFDVFDLDGYGYCGTVMIEDGFIPLSSRGSLLAGIHRGEYGEQLLRIVRIEGGTGCDSEEGLGR